MRILITVLFIAFSFVTNSQVWVPTPLANMPKSVSNNAVCEAKVNGVDYMYSFAGIDSTKTANGILLDAFKYNVSTDAWSSIPALPDTLGKIAAAASNVKGKIYIIGGYHVLSGGGEVSSSRVHIFDPVNDIYLSNGQDVPVAIDDQVQCVWRDSLIYVITGWSNTTNVENVQIYNPTNDTWQSGTSVPGNANYKVFGSQGIISGDTIYYYGGASIGTNFPTRNLLRIGIIDPNNPLNITWLPTKDFASHSLYRMIGLNNPDGNITFLGGSAQSYNYDGLAYTNGVGVPPANEQIVYSPNLTSFTFNNSQVFPMDLRGYANVSPAVKYICGGMEVAQKVSNKTFKLSYVQALSSSDLAKEIGLKVYPNPTNDYLNISYKNYSKPVHITLLNQIGQTMLSGEVGNDTRLKLANLSIGHYFLIFNIDGEKSVHTISKE